ncbi:MAG: helix-turn-helix domain-containing protein [Evtepia sp.]
MKIDLKKLDLLLARECKSLSDLRDGSSPQTLKRIRRGEEVQPKTVGRIARALGCDPSDILEGGN